MSGQEESWKEERYDYMYKVVVVGDSGVGKSALLTRYADAEFVPGYTSTIGVDFKIRTKEIAGQKVKMQVWDTAGQERFRTITTSYYRGAHGILIVYDVTHRQSFNNIKSWFAEVRKHGMQNTKLILLGNKSDLTTHRAVETAEGAEVARHYGAEFMETSAKEAANVELAFDSVALALMDRRPTESTRNPVTLSSEVVFACPPGVKKETETTTAKAKCCCL